MPADSPLRARFNHLFALKWHVGDCGPSGLPSAEQYRVVAAYEAAIFDTLEASGRGVLVFTRTHAATVQHVAYVDDVKYAAGLVDQCASAPADLELSALPDDRWRYVDGQQQRIEGLPRATL